MSSKVKKITKEFLQGSWQEIAKKLAQAKGQVFLQKQITTGAVSLRAVVRVADAMPGLLLVVPELSAPNRWKVKSFSGVKFDPAVKLTDGLGLPVFLVDHTAQDVFATLAADIGAAISEAKTPKEAVAALLNRVAIWRRFLKNRAGKMSDEEVMGLIGELCILDRLVASTGTDAALEAWKGPLGELHDFRLPDYRVEVKAWSNDNIPRVVISNPSQVFVDAACPVWIAAAQVYSHEKTGRCLAEWIEGLSKKMDAAQRDVFDSLLADYGYLSAHADLYTRPYSIGTQTFYRVTEKFPRIKPEQIPSGISWMKYAIDINSISSFAKEPPF